MPTETRRRELVVEGRNRMAGYLGPFASSLTLAWLASHRGRLHTLVLGGKRLSLLIVWDTAGAREVNRSEADIEALRQVVYGDVPHA